MAHTTSVSGAEPQLQIPKLSVREIAPWAILFGIVGLLALYFVGAEQGATSIFSGTAVHEWVHDGRHLLGFPCH